MYDSFLYGNGLSLSILSKIKETTSSPLARYLDCSLFINEFARSQPHSKILREYSNLFTITKESQEVHAEALSTLGVCCDEISGLGFERWVSKYLFQKDRTSKTTQTYIYMLYNYWYHVISREIISSKAALNIISSYSSLINNLLENNCLIFTTNFDSLLDNNLSIQHLHGRFVVPLAKVNDIISHTYEDGTFEYRYLFGTSGLEKTVRLKGIQKTFQHTYDLDFFYNTSLNLGSLLIYGLSFGKTEFMSDEFLDSNPDHKQLKLIMSVDGHIIEKLSIKHQAGQLTKITISYYSDADLANYNNIFQDSAIEHIIEYKHCDEILLI